MKEIDSDTWFRVTYCCCSKTPSKKGSYTLKKIIDGDGHHLPSFEDARKLSHAVSKWCVSAQVRASRSVPRLIWLVVLILCLPPARSRQVHVSPFRAWLGGSCMPRCLKPRPP